MRVCTGPGAARNIIAKVTETSVDVRWTAPRGQHKYAYEVELKDMSNTLKSVTEPAATFADLSAVTTYIFVVVPVLGNITGDPAEETFTTSKSLHFSRSTFILSSSNNSKGL